MSAEPLMRVWGFLLMLVAVEVGLFVALFAVVQRRIASAAWRRTCAQAAVVGVLMIALFELTGAGRGIAGWAANTFQNRGHTDVSPQTDFSKGLATARVTDVPPAKAGTDPSDAATGLQLKASFRSEVEARLARSEGRVPEAIVPVDAGTKSVSKMQPVAGSGGSGRSQRINTETITGSDSIAVLWVFVIWVSGSGLVAARACLGRFLFVVFRFRQRGVAEEQVIQRVSSLAHKLGIARRVRVVESARLTSPIAFGILHQTIGLPLEFGKRFAPGQQEAMLAHELAHLAAHDPFWCLAADAASALLWWHPAVWWLRRQLQLSSELAADEASLVVAHGPGLLAECLVEIGSLMSRTPLLGQLHMAGFNSCLGRRVQRLVHLEGRSWSPPRRLPSTLVRGFGPLAFAVMVILCSGWVIPRSITNGETMKAIQLNWKHSLATLALLASVNTGGAAADADAQRTSESLHAKIIPVKDVVPSAVAAQVQPTLENKRSRVEADDRTQQVVVLATDKEMKEAEYTIARLDTPRPAPAAGPVPYPAPVSPPQVPRGGGPGAPPIPAGPGQAEDAFRQRYGFGPGMGPGTPVAAAAGGRRRAPMDPGMANRSGVLDSKLREIVLEEASFDNLPLGEVLKILSDESRKHDRDKRGINFLINPNAPAPAMAPLGAGGPIDPATGLPMAMAAAEVVDLSGVTIKFNMPLRDVTMKDVLDAIVKVADKPIEYALEDYAVVFSLRPDLVVPMSPAAIAQHPPLSVRTFKVDTNTFVAGLESAFGIKIESSNGGSGARSRKIQAALRELLTQLGVSMEGSKAVFYNELTGIVMARATYDDLDVFHAAIATLGGENTEPSRGFGEPPGRFPGPKN